jgi:protein bicaudal D
MATLDELKLEVDRLTRELDQAVSEKIQSAQYGLVLLEEKQALEQKVEELDTMYESTRSELDITQEVRLFIIRSRSGCSCVVRGIPLYIAA